MCAVRSIQDQAQRYTPSKDCWCEGTRRIVLGRQFTKDPSPVSSGWHTPSPPSSFPCFVSRLSAPLSFHLTLTLLYCSLFPRGFKNLTHPSVLASDSPHPNSFLPTVLLCMAWLRLSPPLCLSIPGSPHLSPQPHFHNDKDERRPETSGTSIRRENESQPPLQKKTLSSLIL